MNGVHDMGGQHGMGPVEYEKDEPVFHAPGRGEYTHSAVRFGPGANGASIPTGMQLSSCLLPTICE